MLLTGLLIVQVMMSLETSLCLALQKVASGLDEHLSLGCLPGSPGILLGHTICFANTSVGLLATQG